MKAAIRTGILGYTLSFTEDHPQPSASPKRRNDDDDPLLLIKVHAGAINPIDYKLPRLALGPVYGLDFCGSVIGVCEGRQGRFGVGDLVFGWSTNGTLAEYTLARSSEIASAPEGWKATDCAALPTGHVSALQCLREGGILPTASAKSISNANANANLKSVLIIGASGGCGLAAVQLCSALGVSRIVGICSAKNRDLVLGHGATEVVEYSDASAVEAFYGNNRGALDCVLDAASNSGGGEDYWNERTKGLLKKGGRYVGLNGPASKWVRFFAGAQSEGERMVTTEHRGSDLELVADLLGRLGDANGSSNRPLTTLFAFDAENVTKGFDLLKSRRARGKIVFDVLGASSSSSSSL